MIDYFFAALAKSLEESAERAAQREYAKQRDSTYRIDWLLRRTLGIPHVPEDIT